MNSNELCAHLKMLSKGVIPNDLLQQWIGRLSSLEQSTFLKFCSELKLLLQNRLGGTLQSLQPNQFEAITFLKNKEAANCPEINGQFIPRDIAIRRILSLEPNHPTHQRYLAGLMSLKTAVPARDSRSPVSRSKLDLHYKAITQPYQGCLDLDTLKEEISAIVSRLVKKAKLQQLEVDDYHQPLHLVPESDVAVATINQYMQTCTRKRNTLMAYNIQRVLNHPRIRDLYNLDPERFTNRLFIGVKGIKSFVNWKDEPYHDDLPLSVIRFLPQAGDKERVVTVANLVYQSLSFPLMKIAKAINNSWNIQGVKSHAKTVIDIHNRLAKTTKAKHVCNYHSIDMSNFTDRLPYRGLIRQILISLEELGIISQFDILLMDYICEGKCLFPDKGNITYGVGTPQGTYPSFHLASLANGVISTICYCRSNEIDINIVNLDSLPCRIIGDDIVIWEDKTAQYYKEMMTSIGVEVQPSKTITSPRVAEMCSKVITPEGVYEQIKLDRLSKNDTGSIKAQYLRYGLPLLSYLDEDGLSQLSKLTYMPQPFGLGPEISEDFYWSTLPSLRQIINAKDLVRDLSLDQLRLTPKQIEIMSQRQRLYPEIVITEYPSYDHKVGTELSNQTFFYSLIDEIRHLSKELSKPGYDFYKYVEISNRILEKYEYLSNHFSYHLSVIDKMRVPQIIEMSSHSRKLKDGLEIIDNILNHERTKNGNTIRQKL